MSEHELLDAVGIRFAHLVHAGFAEQRGQPALHACGIARADPASSSLARSASRSVVRRAHATNVLPSLAACITRAPRWLSRISDGSTTAMSSRYWNPGGTMWLAVPPAA